MPCSFQIYCDFFLQDIEKRRKLNEMENLAEQKGIFWSKNQVN